MDTHSSNPQPDERPVIADLAANIRENDTARLVRRFYEEVLSARYPTQGQSQSSSTDAASNEDEDDKILEAPVLPLRRSTSIVSFHALQEWEGYVTSKSEEVFTADLVDMTRGSKQPDEQVELSNDEVGFEQRNEIRIGAVFRWTIGYESLPSGQRRRVSQIVFRQLPRWTQKDIDSANCLSTERHGQIKWE